MKSFKEFMTEADQGSAPSGTSPLTIPIPGSTIPGGGVRFNIPNYLIPTGRGPEIDDSILDDIESIDQYMPTRKPLDLDDLRPGGQYEPQYRPPRRGRPRR